MVGWMSSGFPKESLDTRTTSPPPTEAYTADPYTKLLLHFDGPDQSRHFPGDTGAARYFSKEGQVKESVDRSGKVTRYVYDYDERGNQIGIYQMTYSPVPVQDNTAAGGGETGRTKFSGEVRDQFGRIIRQISDSGAVTYFTYELDAFGGVRKVWLHETEPENVSVRRNLLQIPGAVSISGNGWTSIQMNSDRKNYLTDGTSSTYGYVSVDQAEKPLTFDFTGHPAPQANGDVQIDTSQSKFGGSSARFDGNGDFIAVNDHSDFDFGTGDFTIDAWVNFESTNGVYTIASDYDSPRGWLFVADPANQRMLLYDAGHPSYGHHAVIANGISFEANRWYHLAVVRTGNTIKFFVDGAQRDGNKSIDSTYAYRGFGTQLKIGICDSNTSAFKGWMDELRISKGIARWAENFIPPTEAYTADPYTKLLLHFDGPDQSRHFPSATHVPQTVDLSRIRLQTYANANLGYRIEGSRDGINWHTVVDRSTGGLKDEWNDHEVNETGIMKLRIVPVGVGELHMREIQIYEAPREEKNFQIMREFDRRGNITSETNILYHVWNTRPELKLYFPDPEKKGVFGRWKDKTLIDWAGEEGWLEDPRLNAYRPQLDAVTTELKDAFDSRRDLQRQFTNDALLLDWAKMTGYINDPHLLAYRPGHIQDNTPATGYSGHSAFQIPQYGPPVEEWRSVFFTPEGGKIVGGIYSGAVNPSVTDGNPNTYGAPIWWYANSEPASMVMELSEVSRIGMTRYRLGGDRMNYSIEASLDGKTWFTVVDKTNNTAIGFEGWYEDHFPPVEAKYLRLTGVRNRDNNQSISVYEFEAYEKIENPIPISIEHYNESGALIGTDNALFNVWRSDAGLQRLFPNPQLPSTAPGRWQNKTLVQWAQEEGHKHYANLALYAPANVNYILPGLRQVFDDSRALQDRFRIDGNTSSGLIKYARERGWREDWRLFHYGNFSPSREPARKNTFEVGFDRYGNQSLMIARDHNGMRTQRRFNAEGQLIEEKDELMLLWEENAALYRDYTVSGALKSWADNIGSKDSVFGRVLMDYSPYTIGGPVAQTIVSRIFSYLYDSSGFLKELRQSNRYVEGSEWKYETTTYDQDGNVLGLFDSSESTFAYTMTKDNSGRPIYRQGGGWIYSPAYEWIPVDQPMTGGPVGLGSVAAGMLIAYFQLLLGREPALDELNQELRFINEQGFYPSRARLSLNPDVSLRLGAATATGMLDPSKVLSYGMSGQEISKSRELASSLLASRENASRTEERLETKHLEVLAQKIFRKLLGRDPNETDECGFWNGDCDQGKGTELGFIAVKLKELDSTTAFEEYLKNDYNKDASGKSEHDRRTDEVTQIINRVDSLLREYFGGAFNASTDSLHGRLREALKFLKSDPGLSLKELSASELDKIKSRLLELITEDLHFGQSAAHAVSEMLKAEGTNIPHSELTVMLLFIDSLTGVLSPEFIGNLQFSAYALKTLAQTYGLDLKGVRLGWNELVALVQAGHYVLASIEDRHFVVVTGIRICTEITALCPASTVTFLENGYLRTKSVEEFKARWFGVALVKEEVLSLLPPSTTLKVLSTQELLKIKGAGWLKKLFKKIKKFFQAVVKVAVKVIQKVTSFITKAFTAAFGKTIGGALGGIVNGLINIFTAPIHIAYYSLNGDVKGLLKYWGSVFLQVVLVVVVALVAPYLLGPLMSFLGTILQGIGGFLSAAGGLIGSSLGAGIGSAIGGAIQAAGALISRAGTALIQQAAKLINQSHQFFKDLKTGGFSYLKDLLKQSVLDKMNPLPRIDIFRTEQPDGLSILYNVRNSLSWGAIINFTSVQTSKKSLSSLDSLIVNLALQAGTQLAQNKIDQKLESAKMNSFLKSLISSVSSVSLNAFADALIPLASTVVDTGKAVFSHLQSGIEALGRGISLGFNSAKSFVSNLIHQIPGLRGPPVNSPTLSGGSLIDPVTGKPRMTFSEGYVYAMDEEGTPYQITPEASKNPFDLKPLTYDNISRAQLDDGRFVDLVFDPDAREYRVVEIGSQVFERQIPTTDSFNFKDALFDLFTQGPVGVGQRISDLIPRPIAERINNRIREIGLNFVDYNNAVFEGSQFGAGVGGKVKIRLGPIQFEASAHDITGYRYERIGVVPIRDVATEIKLTLGGFIGKYDFDEQSFSFSGKFREFEIDDAFVVSLGGTLPYPVPPYPAANGELKLSLIELIRLQQLFRRRDR